jgi:urease accessory protein UreF
VTVDVIGVESPGVGVTTFGVACASWINSSAEAWYALQQIVAAKKIIAGARMTLLRYRTKPF